LQDNLLKTYKAIIAYDGTDFLGFQIQAQGRTVQGVLEHRLAQMAKTSIRVVGAGRTDAGVHATGQVISFKLPWKHSTAKLEKALNATLPNDLVITTLTTTYDHFHPRFDARSRQYRYTILNQPHRDVIKQRYVTHIARPLDVSRMQKASSLLLGTHDFASFGRPPQGNNTIRTITQAEWLVDGSEIQFYVTANAFLYRMVRSIVGTLIQIGIGRMEVDDMKHVLQAKDRSKAGAPALTNGLCLINVNY